MTTVNDFLKSIGQVQKTTTSITTHDFFNNVVQFDDSPNLVASGEASLLFSGPPLYPDSQGGMGKGGNAQDIQSMLVPIGTVQGIQDAGTNGVVPFREVGSKIKRFARASADYRVTIGKILTYHSNLAHAFYAWMAQGTAASENAKMTYGLRPGMGSGADVESKHLFVLDSELFSIPFGLCLVTVTGGGTKCSVEYWEKCLIADYGKSIGAGQPMIQEQVSITMARKVAANGLNFSINSAKNPFIITRGNDS